jgi:hypothetical protein
MLRTTVSRPVYLGIKHPFGAYDQIFISVRVVPVCSCGALSLTRGRNCRLQLLLALARAVILGSESRGTRDHILLAQIRDFPFRRLLRLAELWWRYSTISNSSSTILCLSVATQISVNVAATVWFSQPYNFQFSYPRKPCSVTSCFPRINLPVAMFLPIRFLENRTCHTQYSVWASGIIECRTQSTFQLQCAWSAFGWHRVASRSGTHHASIQY